LNIKKFSGFSQKRLENPRKSVAGQSFISIFPRPKTGALDDDGIGGATGPWFGTKPDGRRGAAGGGGGIHRCWKIGPTSGPWKGEPLWPQKMG
jgi:hypothetical protein